MCSEILTFFKNEFIIVHIKNKKKLNSRRMKMIKNYTYAACIAATLSLFTACGDDVTEVTNVNESASIDQVDKYKKLPKCEKENDGSLVFVKDSAKVYICTDKNWISMNGGNVEKDSAGVSGKDGSDGKDGSNGKDGKAGADGSDGKDGKDGKDGSSCTAKQNKNKDGYDIICNGETIGTIKNGEDGKDGEKGENGDDCTLTEGENGVVTVKCGSNSATLYKAVCGTGSYDPATQNCGYSYDGVTGEYINYVPVQRCKDWSEAYDWYKPEDDQSNSTYNAAEYFCDENSVLQPMCRWEDDEGNLVTKKYDSKTEYCDFANKKIAKKVPCAEGSKELRKPTEYCFTTNDNPKMQREEMLVCGEGNSAKEYSPVTHFCKKSTGILGKKSICAADPDKADKFNIDIRYMAEENVDDHTSEMCDTRDYQIYKTKTAESGHTWMVDFLRYAYNGKTSTLDSSSFCYNDHYDGKGGSCGKLGRFYLWSAVIDSLALTKSDIFCGYEESENCKLPETVRGVCPEGWHVPSADEAKEDKIGWPEVYAPIALRQKLDGSMEWSDNWKGGIWTATEESATSAKRFHPGSTSLLTNEKSVAFNVRCIKDYEKETAQED